MCSFPVDTTRPTLTVTPAGEHTAAGDAAVCPVRVADYLLGGHDHEPADRAFGDLLTARCPRWPGGLRAARDFGHRALRALGTCGVTQVIDLSGALPDRGALDGVLDGVPGFRLVRVEPDPDTARRARRLLDGTPHRVLGLDTADPREVLRQAHRSGALDPARPTGLVVTTGALELAGDTAAVIEALGRWARLLPAGSRLVISHGTQDGPTATDATDAHRAGVLYRRIGRAVVVRSLAEVNEVLAQAGWYPLRPLTYAEQWHPGAPDTPAPWRACPRRHPALVLVGIAAHQPPPPRPPEVAHGRTGRATGDASRRMHLDRRVIARWGGRR